jgi:hypothetical protein
MISELEFSQFSEDLQIKEIYATFGVCIYQFQVVEQQLMNMILIYSRINHISSNITELDQVFENNKSKTMGKLIQSVLNDFKIIENDKKNIWSLHERRNYYAHHYFKDKISEWFSAQGRLSMLLEISNQIEFAEEIDHALMLYLEPYLAKMKVTSKLVEEIQEEYVSGIRKLDHMIYEEKKDV